MVSITPWWWYFRQAYNIFTLVKFAKLSPNPLSSSRRQDKVISESRTEGRHQQNWWSICIVTIMSFISRIVLSKNFFVLNMGWYVIMWMTLCKESKTGAFIFSPLFNLLPPHVEMKWSWQCCLSKSNIMMWANSLGQLPRQNWRQHFCFRFPRKFNFR